MKRILFNKLFLFLLLLSLPLALATTSLQTDNTAYSLGSPVTMSGSCSSAAAPVGLRALLQATGDVVWFNQATSDGSNHYTDNFIPPQKGNYTITAACQGDFGVTASICVGTATECSVVASAPGGGDQNNNNGNNGGPSGSTCKPNWIYSDWSSCDAALKQTRTATDSHCGKQPKQEDLVQACTTCEESWTCGDWSECTAGVQQHTCTDDHACGTTLLIPPQSRSCEVPGSTVVSHTTPPLKTFFSGVIDKTVSFWDQYLYWIIGVPLAILLLILLIVLLRVLFKKKFVYDEKEVRDWARRERAAGTSMDDVKQIIGQYTNWHPDVVDRVVNGLR